MSEPRLLLAADLDGTLFRSRRDRQEGDFAVDSHDGKPCAFMSCEIACRLAELMERIWFVPVTTRSVSQYSRIAWPPGCEPRIAVTSNGGRLLRSGCPDPAWDSPAGRISPTLRSRMTQLAAELREKSGVRSCAVVDDLFVCAACGQPGQAAALQAQIVPEPLLPLRSGRKLYLLPPGLDKGAALLRLRALPEFAQIQVWIAAGDSVLDVPMLRHADCAIVPPRLAAAACASQEWTAPDRGDLPEFVIRKTCELAASDLQVQSRA